MTVELVVRVVCEVILDILAHAFPQQLFWRGADDVGLKMTSH
jgi:hypothetical protein